MSVSVSVSVYTRLNTPSSLAACHRLYDDLPANKLNMSYRFDILLPRLFHQLKLYTLYRYMNVATDVDANPHLIRTDGAANS